MTNNNYIVSLTTIPSKFDYLHNTIDSIINQTILPKKIIVNIPKIYNFRMNSTEIPVEKLYIFTNNYAKHNVFINLIDNDYGPGTKLLGLLNSNILSGDNYKENTYILLIDDDLIYKPYMIEYFDDYIKTNPNIEAASYCVYKYNVKLGHGADGFFIKMNNLIKFTQYYDLIKDHDYVNYHDDYYISYYLYLLGIDIRHIIPPYNSIIYSIHNDTYIDALCALKDKYERNNLNFKLTEILNEINKNGLFKPLKI
jgi:hypothetical protein